MVPQPPPPPPPPPPPATDFAKLLAPKKLIIIKKERKEEARPVAAFKPPKMANPKLAKFQEELERLFREGPKPKPEKKVEEEVKVVIKPQPSPPRAKGGPPPPPPPPPPPDFLQAKAKPLVIMKALEPAEGGAKAKGGKPKIQRSKAVFKPPKNVNPRFAKIAAELEGAYRALLEDGGEEEAQVQVIQPVGNSSQIEINAPFQSPRKRQPVAVALLEPQPMHRLKKRELGVATIQTSEANTSQTYVPTIVQRAKPQQKEVVVATSPTPQLGKGKPRVVVAAGPAHQTKKVRGFQKAELNPVNEFQRIKLRKVNRDSVKREQAVALATLVSPVRRSPPKQKTVVVIQSPRKSPKRQLQLKRDTKVRVNMAQPPVKRMRGPKVQAFAEKFGG